MSRYVWLCALLVTGCDCDDNDPIGRGEQDTTPPTVVLVTPTHGATDVAVDVTIAATFSEAIAPTSLDPATFAVSNAGGAIPGAVSWDEATLTATFAPDNTLTRSATYTALLSPTVTDRAGNPLAAEHGWTFSTSGASLTHHLVAATEASHGWPRFAVNAAGDILATWEVRTGTGSKTLFAFADHMTGTWSAEAALDVEGGVASVISNGVTFLVVARSYYGGLYALIYDGTTWGTAATLASGMVQPGQAVTNGTTYAVAWTRSGRMHVSILNGTSWSDTDLTASTTGSANSLQLASNGSGYAALWRQTDNTRFNLHASIFDGTWSARTDLETSDVSVEAYTPRPTLASNGSGYVAVWGQDGLVHANRYVGGGWSGAQVIDTNSNTEDYMCVASNGSSYAAIWRQLDDTATTYRRVYAAFYDGAWSIAAPIDAGTADSSTLRLQTSGADYRAVWREGSVATGLYPNLRAARATDIGGWSWSVDPVPLDTGSAEIGAVDLACAGATCTALWQQEDTLYANSYVSAAWAGEILLEQGGELQSQVLVATASGFLAGWNFERGPEAANVYARRLDSGAWGDRHGLAQSTYLGSSERPALATNAAGVTVAVWSQYDLGTDSLYAAVHEDDLWGAPMLVSPHVTESPHVAAGASSAVIMWTDNSDVWVATWNGALASPEKLNDTSEESPNPKLLWTPAGPTVIWLKLDGAQDTLVTRTHDGTSWGAIQTAYAAAESVDTLRAASSGTGHALVWHEVGATNDLKAMVHDGTSWGPVTTLDLLDDYVESPTVAGSDSGYGVVWMQNDGSADNLYASVFDGSGWSTPVELDVSDEPPDGHRVAGHATGLVATWVQYDGNHERTFARLWDGGAWSAAVALSADTSDARSPRVAGGGDERVVLWMQEHVTESWRHELFLRRHDGTDWSVSPVPFDTTSDVRQPVLIFNCASFSAAWVEQDPADDAIWKVRVRLGF